MIDTKLEEPSFAIKKTNQQTSCTPASLSPAISCLASSKACGLAMLVDKLLASGTSNAATKHLIRALINRLPHNTIIIEASSEDHPENFVLDTMKAAEKFSYSQGGNPASLDTAAALLNKAVKAFEMELVGVSTLEHNWKEFIFHFYRTRLQLLESQ